MMTTNQISIRSVPRMTWILLFAIGVPFLWAYWSTFAAMGVRWWNDAQYSHGFLVPVFAAGLLWLRRDRLKVEELRPEGWGIGLILAGAVLRMFGAYYFITPFDALSILPCLAGFCVLLGGWAALRWAWPAIAFLFFMMPLPYGLETALAYPLRRIATLTSTYALQTVGFPALAEGTNIYFNDHHLQIAPACSGLGMLLIFFALSTAIALLIERPWPDKLVILVSALPIAVIANIWRIFVTAILFQFASQELAHKVFHDWAGFLMMPVALLLLWGELKILDHLFVVVEHRKITPFDFRAPRTSRRRTGLQGEA
jgi:exosortase